MSTKDVVNRKQNLKIAAFDTPEKYIKEYPNGNSYTPKNRKGYTFSLQFVSVYVYVCVCMCVRLSIC